MQYYVTKKSDKLSFLNFPLTHTNSINYFVEKTVKFGTGNSVYTHFVGKFLALKMY